MKCEASMHEMHPSMYESRLHDWTFIKLVRVRWLNRDKKVIRYDLISVRYDKIPDE